MANMKQPGTDYGSRSETGEREPKGDTSSDRSGERSGRKIIGVGIGERDKQGTQEGGVGRSGMGSKDKGEYNTGRSESVCYNHKRIKHPQDGGSY